MARTSLGPLKFDLDMTVSSRGWFIVAPCQESNGINLGMSFRYTSYYYITVC